jgi:hypothetical protein
VNVELLEKAFFIALDAAYQSHNGHWDMTGQGGRGCPECIRASELRNKARELYVQATKKGEEK